MYSLMFHILHEHSHERIAFWAEQYIDVPYDTDPWGDYVRKNVIVADERVDCMYLTFRSVELALGRITSYNVCYTKLLRSNRATLLLGVSSGMAFSANFTAEMSAPSYCCQSGLAA